MSDRETQHKLEAAQFVKDFYARSYSWRDSSYHEKWNRWENNYRSIYDPDIKAKKESWQSTMFDPLTVTQVEVIATSITKILFAKKHPIGFAPRECGDELQAELHNALLDFQLDRSDFAISAQDTLRQCLIFGTGFTKIFWERKEEKRRIQQRQFETFMEAFKNNRFLPKERKRVEEIQNVLVSNQIKAHMVPIRDIFLAPNSIDLNMILHRNKVTYGELVDLSSKENSAGYPLIDREAVEMLRNVRETDAFEVDVATSKQNQGIYEETVPVPDYAKKHSVWEYYGLIPRKWIDLKISDNSDDANELIPGKILVASGQYFLASEVNPFQSMSPPFLRMDYIPTGQTYAMGVCQLLEGLQEEINEIRNQRVDNVNMVMNKIFVVLEKYLVDPKDLRSAPHAIIRIKGNQVDDWRKVMGELQVSDITLSAYKETFEIERKAQEVAGGNRVTTGSAGLVRDANQTLGGMELLKQSAADRFSVYSYNIGRRYFVSAAKKFMELIYQNMNEEEIKRVLGEKPLSVLGPDGRDMAVARYLTFRKMPPHEMEKDYDLVPYDVFSEENKFAKAQMLMSFGQFIASTQPGWNPRPLQMKVGMLNGMEKAEVEELLGPERGPMPTPMAMGKGIPSIAKAQKPTVNEGPTTPTPLAGGGAPL